MSLDASSGGWLQDTRLDVLAAVAGLVVALALVPLRFVASQVLIETVPLVVATGCVLYLLAVRNEGVAGVAYVSTGLARLLPSVSVLGMAGMVLVGATSGRSDLFFAIASVVGTVILAQVLLVAEEDFHRGILLAQVIGFGMVLRLVGLYATPGYVGVDVWTHVPNWSAKILETHSLAPIADRKYYASPLFHLLVVSASMLFDVSLRTATHLTVGIAMGLSAVLVYATTSLFTSARWAVFATALFTASGSVIEWGLSLFPTSLGLLFFLAILYCMMRILYTDYGATDFLLVVFFSVAVILTHQISSFIMLVFLGASLLAKLLLRLDFLEPEQSSAMYFSPQDTVNVTGLLVFDLGLITFMWSLTPYHGASFLETTFIFFYDTAATSGGFLDLASASASAGDAAAGPTLLAAVVRYTDVLGFLILFSLTILGSLYMLRRRNVSHAGVTTILSVVVMLAFVFGFPLFGIRTFVPGRWFAFIAAPMVVLGAIGVGFLSEEASPRVALAIVFVIVLIFPAISITSAAATVDDPPIESVQTRYGYSEPELAAVETIGRMAPAGEDVHTDHPYETVFDRTEAHRSDDLMIADGAAANETAVWRSYQSSGAAYFAAPGDVAFQPVVTREQVCGDREVTYSNGEVAYCTPPPE